MQIHGDPKSSTSMLGTSRDSRKQGQVAAPAYTRAPGSVFDPFRPLQERGKRDDPRHPGDSFRDLSIAEERVEERKRVGERE
ncbi:hypothetical protein M569_17692 [Genlisea aurea]|uniref:Uncharacterized protein n=1 Tax=Genlisea aurea TaxID=192259 RepID=S8BR74_9LAMI|nr:hypothetical protein M569_17692 [Genlisea aurea]